MMKAHLINCTYCEHRLVTPGDKKRRSGEIERCKLTMQLIPSPSHSGRFCEQFHQSGHACERCRNY